MPQAQITINAAVGSDDDLPLDTLVQLDNNNIGGEVSFLWEILDQPVGVADVLSSAVIQNPTFTPQKEGTYLIRLTVNQGLPDEDIDTVIAAVRQLKTRERVPAAGEQVEDNPSRGWAEDMNVFLRTIDGHIADPGIVVGTNATAGVLARGTVVRATSTATIKSGLPGEEKVPGFTTAPATLGTNLDELLLVVERGVDGSDPVAAGALMECRFLGKLDAITLGAGAVGDPIFVSDTATLSIASGTNIRQVGSISAVSGADRDIWFSGNQGGNQAPVDRAYLVYGDPGPLSAALRVDGLNAGAIINNIPVTFRGGDLTTVPLVAKKFSGAATADLQQWHDETSTVLLKVDEDGNLISTADGTFIVITATTGTFANLTSTIGLRVGFAGVAPANTIEIGDANFQLNFDGTDPSVVWDAGDDRILYDRSTNKMSFQIGGTEEIAILAEGVVVANGMVIGHAGTPLDDILSVGDVDFRLDAATINTPTINFKTSGGVARIRFNRTTNEYTFVALNNTSMFLNDTGMRVQFGGVEVMRLTSTRKAVIRVADANFQQVVNPSLTDFSTGVYTIDGGSATVGTAYRVLARGIIEGVGTATAISVNLDIGTFAGAIQVLTGAPVVNAGWSLDVTIVFEEVGATAKVNLMGVGVIDEAGTPLVNADDRALISVGNSASDLDIQLVANASGGDASTKIDMYTFTVDTVSDP